MKPATLQSPCGSKALAFATTRDTFRTFSMCSTAGNGLRVFSGSNVVVTDSAFLRNTANGVVVSTYAVRALASSSLAKVNLGAPGASGRNTFPAIARQGANGGVGICFDVAANTGVLEAVANTFRTFDCSTQASTLVANLTSCASTAAACTGGICDVGFSSAAQAVGNSFEVTKCTQ